MPYLPDTRTLSPTEEAAQSPASRYRAFCGLSLVSLIFGVLSVFVLFDWFLAVLPILGIIAGYYARKTIRKNPEETTGMALAWTGMGISLFFWVCGYGWLLIGHIREVPFGYERVEYEELQPDPGVKDEFIPPGAYQYQDRKVFVKGYMTPTRQQTHLKQFILCPLLPNNCPSCPANPKPTEKIIVTLTGDLEADYTTYLVKLGGTFKINPEAAIGIPYALEADFIR
jgi:hypothetical protein